jgi:hypothetical protein
MRRTLAIGIALAMATIVLIAVPLKVWAPAVSGITPKSGKVGHTAVIHGSGFKGAGVEIKFGEAKAEKVDINSDRVIRCTVPPKHPLDIFFNIDPVPVTVTIDGILVGEVQFSYKTQKPEPVITSFDPPFAVEGTEFTIMMYGTGLMTPQGRVPDRAFLIGPEVVEAAVFAESESVMGVEPSPFMPVGSYEILVSFSDGSGAVAEGLFEIVLL